LAIRATPNPFSTKEAIVCSDGARKVGDFDISIEERIRRMISLTGISFSYPIKGYFLIASLMFEKENDNGEINSIGLSIIGIWTKSLLSSVC
jgi:hypothetical protein